MLMQCKVHTCIHTYITCGRWCGVEMRDGEQRMDENVTILDVVVVVVQRHARTHTRMHAHLCFVQPFTPFQNRRPAAGDRENGKGRR